MVMTKIIVIPMNMIVVFTMHMVLMIKSHSCSLWYVCNLNCRVYNIIPEVDWQAVCIDILDCILSRLDW